jgi:hypothetical protein
MELVALSSLAKDAQLSRPPPHSSPHPPVHAGCSIVLRRLCHVCVHGPATRHVQGERGHRAFLSPFCCTGLGWSHRTRTRRGSVVRGAGPLSGACCSVLAQVRMQARPDAFQGPLQCLITTVKEEGLAALWKGSVPALVRPHPVCCPCVCVDVCLCVRLLGLGACVV